MVSGQQLPLWIKLVFTAWILFWAPAYAILLGAENYFWLCNLASFLILIGLWLESRPLLSMQWLSVVLIGLLWGLDLAVAWLTGWHPFGGTAYMLDPDFPNLARLLSFYHLLLPLVAGYAIFRVGYQAKALLYQTLLTWLMIALTYWLTDPERNINWVHAPFGVDQDFLPPMVYLVVLALAWPVLIYLPVHFLTLWLERRRHRS